ncbi:MAG TPA: alpha-amylase [Lentisphaeria bacterium]|nr:MAG: alpha-amylase [Lentisphaerae bacterium GWF2_50_93]HCE44599.1 alpha-amylase [Lentisphaeria bacterium]
MQAWPKYPFIYEINTFVWLNELSEKYKRAVSLGSVPKEEWDYLESFGFDAVWFMGIWERSPAGIKIASANNGLMSEFRKVLPDFQDKDLVGSAYCVKSYVVDRKLGGPEGLAHARDMLAKRGIRLILDFVPNHVAPDHPWASSHPENFIRGSEEDLRNDPSSFIRIGKNVIALGRDPYFPAWPDVLQLNAFSRDLRKTVLETVSEIADQCDGIRCDMAMLMMNKIFERTWGARAGQKPSDDYWSTLIPAIKSRSPGFLFIAEAYWDLEWELQQQGFDFCYDKKLYDRMEHNGAEAVRQHLLADMAYQDRLIRFIENHDEPRAASSFSCEKEKMAGVAFSTLPGARLFHEGQFEGRKARVPVFLGRRPSEGAGKSNVGFPACESDSVRNDQVTISGNDKSCDIKSFYLNLMSQIGKDVFRNGSWQSCEIRGWADNNSCQNLLAWTWRKDDFKYLIIVNFSDSIAQGMVRLQWDDICGKVLRLTDSMNGEKYERLGSEMVDNGLYADLRPWSCHFFRIET